MVKSASNVALPGTNFQLPGHYGPDARRRTEIHGCGQDLERHNEASYRGVY